jgi:hypothetical protein
MFETENSLEAKPKRVQDRPARPRPQEIAHRPTQPWLASTNPSASLKKDRSSLKGKVDYGVRIAMPTVGVIILGVIGYRIFDLITGVYS